MCKKFILQKSRYTPAYSRITTYRENLTIQQSHITPYGCMLKKSLITTCIFIITLISFFSLITTHICAATVYDVDTDSDEYMLQKMAVAEAEDQGVWGQALVMQTILNRVESPDFPDNVRGVLFEENQFTSTSNGRYEECEPNETSREAYNLLKDMRNEGQVYFEKSQNYETWHSKNLEKVTEYRDHIFYKIPGVMGSEKKN